MSPKLWSGIRFECLLIHEETRRSNLCPTCKDSVFKYLDEKYDELRYYVDCTREERQSNSKEYDMYYLQARADWKSRQKIVCEPTSGCTLAVDSSLALYRMRKVDPEAYDRMKGLWARGGIRSKVLYVLEGNYTCVDFHVGTKSMEDFIQLRYQRFLECRDSPRREACSCPEALLARDVRKTVGKMGGECRSSIIEDIIWAAAHLQHWLAPKVDLGLQAGVEHWKALVEKDLRDPAGRDVPVPVLATWHMLEAPRVAHVVERWKRLGEHLLADMEEREVEFEAVPDDLRFSLQMELMFMGESLDFDV